MNIAVVGAGITGCTIARLLADYSSSINIMLYEASKAIGGACSDDIESSAYKQKHGSHIFHTNDEEVWSFLSNYTEWLPYQHKVKSLVYGKEVPVPFNLNSLSLLFTEHKASKIFSDFQKAGYSLGDSFTFEELDKLNIKSFEEVPYLIWSQLFENYSYKQWGIIPEKSSMTRVKAFRLSTDDRYFLDVNQGIPFNGFSLMMSSMIAHPNIHLINNTKFALKEASHFDAVFYTGSIDELFDYVYGELPYRSCRFTTVLTKTSHAFDRPVTNYPSLSYSYTRCHDYSWYMPGYQKAWFAFEYPCEFKRDKNERYYPLNKDKRNTDLYHKYFTYSRTNYPTIYYAGRLGTYQYLDMDRAVRCAIDVTTDFIINSLQTKKH